jgi:methyl-accepting chemotaxis protein
MIQSIQVETKNAVEAMEWGNREVESGVKKTSASGWKRSSKWQRTWAA